MTDTGVSTHLDDLERRVQAIEARLGIGAPSTPAPPAARKPAQVLDLSSWKLTLPIGEKDKPQEILQPQLASYSHPKYFDVAGGGVAFTAPVAGPGIVDTKNSNNKRSELREMNGPKLAAWSSTAGVHSLNVDLAFTRLPAGNDGVGVVGAQIHDAEDDVQVFRLEGSKLWLTNGDTTRWKLIQSDYKLGTRIQVGWRVSVGSTVAFLNGDRVGTLARKYSGAYFKAGCYTQANAGAKSLDETNAGQVVIYSLAVRHS